MARAQRSAPAKRDGVFPTADVSMAVTITLVFADEAHREAWLVGNGLVPAGDARWLTAPPATHARRVDYERRQASQNLTYVVGPLDARGAYVRDPAAPRQQPAGRRRQRSGP